jgi:CBS domain-containing protein
MVSTVAQILEEKSGDVLKIDADATVLDAVRKMVDANIGALLVTAGGEIAGIFTERDYLRRMAVQGRQAEDTLVRDVMTTPLVYVTPETSVDESMALMTDRRIRHLPVADEGAVVGMVSIGDLVKFQSKQQSFQIQYLTDYITAR